MENGAFAEAPPSLAWELGPRAGQADVIHPIFMLRHDEAHRTALEETLWAVSTPGSERYGRYLTREEVARRLPPLPQAEEVVTEWLRRHGVNEVSISTTGDMLEAVIPVPVAEAMFDTQLHHFTMSATGADVIRAVAPHSVPEAVAMHIYVVGDLVHLPALRLAKTAPMSEEEAADAQWPVDCGRSCRNSVTPGVLRAAYGLPPAAANGTGASMAVAEFQGVSYDRWDLGHFQKICGLQSPVAVDKQVGINPGLICKAPLIGGELCAEALLDIEYIKAVSPEIPLTSISALQYSLLNWAKTLDGLDDLPLVQSVSYGNDEVQQSSVAFMDAVNVQFMKLGTRGVSILFASGDQGVYGRSGYNSASRFHPDFPAASPYVTAVGGTDFSQYGVIGAEMAWIASGGGFSDTFAAPAYQKEAVAHYKSTAAGQLPSASLWNATGRGYPDVSALGGKQNPYCVSLSLFLVSSMMGIAGTSASCPVVAGIFARINALRAAHGQPPMGFLNPFIYSHAEAFNDVQSGKNSGGGPDGFAAVAGWDPATGMGTPNFPKLVAAALADGNKAKRGEAEAAIVV